MTPSHQHSISLIATRGESHPRARASHHSPSDYHKMPRVSIQRSTCHSPRVLIWFPLPSDASHPSSRSAIYTKDPVAIHATELAMASRRPRNNRKDQFSQTFDLLLSGTHGRLFVHGPFDCLLCFPIPPFSLAIVFSTCSDPLPVPSFHLPFCAHLSLYSNMFNTHIFATPSRS